ncbi:hypothetical protein CBR_g50275 [Chara braunii]|uniref:Uncharacterized protein n=1 Tax=Chara braunii TaxID=69332 RepID=A0A388M6L7_CHABU|nr:hypothetical protein CBR_g50274 [Chara braunii]GBG90181.1 hypothetical protein CBR_g50275 [Chara braunii]|eukprot:GBG90180.1 hypothetical protein CBR_g50274 [Chara braunii]
MMMYRRHALCDRKAIILMAGMIIVAAASQATARPGASKTYDGHMAIANHGKELQEECQGGCPVGCSCMIHMCWRWNQHFRCPVRCY